jgi:hypothetical protein
MIVHSLSILFDFRLALFRPWRVQKHVILSWLRQSDPSPSLLHKIRHRHYLKQPWHTLNFVLSYINLLKKPDQIHLVR